MAEPFTLQWGELRRSIHAVQERLANPAPVLKQFSRKLSADIKENIRGGGAGWPPYAASTLKRLQSTGSSQITARGTVRANRINRTVRALKKINAQVIEHGWTDQTREKYEKLQKRIKAFRKAETRAKEQGERAAAAAQTLEELKRGPLNRKDARRAEKAQKAIEVAGKDKLGKRQSEGRQLLHGIPGTIRNKIDGNVLLTYSRADKIGKVHNEGAGRTPKRSFLPPPNMEAQLEYLASLLESELGQAWDKG